MKKLLTLFLIIIISVGTAACSKSESAAEDQTKTQTESFHETAASSADIGATAQERSRVEDRMTQTEEQRQEEHNLSLQMMIGDTPVSVIWEDNDAVDAIKELCRSAPLTISMSMYGGFEQVGSLGADLPRNDAQTTTAAGDIVLYSGDQLVVFYGSNTWDYTRLGHITDKTQQELTQLLSNGDITITLTY